jgi:thioredoxin 1
MASDNIQTITDGNFEDTVLKASQPVLVDFWAEWCGPCRTLAPIGEAIGEQYEETALVFKLNVDDSPAVAQRYGIQGIPTLILFQDGVEKERILGVASQEKISRTIDRYIRAALN